MAVIGLGILFVSPPPVFAALAGIVLLGLGGREAGRLAGLEPEQWAAWAFTAAMLLVGLAVYLLRTPATTTTLLVLGAVLWLALLCWLGRPQFGARLWLLKLLALAGILICAWLALITLQAASPWLVLLVVLIIAAADIGAYFSGRAIGGAKLAPSISPGKTRAGAIGGLMAATVITALAVTILPDAPFGPLIAGAVGLGLALVSIGGDLLISLLKRQRGIKDTSTLLPGHGGILDRFDSLGAALPFFALAWLFLGQ
ncbi:MAG: phosphatidate cytidylyltransferase [Wenzhouxiangella sp.]|nr:MAG: phosphatidate cytidylyltransferase [Wenzhouxiangella sp.]